MSKANHIKTGVIYARYSCDNQNEQSIEGQIRVVTDYAKRENIHILDQYIDRAITGRTDDRPEFQRMIVDAKRDAFDYVLVYKYDRFSRNRYDSLKYKIELNKHNIKVLSATEYISDDPQGILFESIIDGYAEYYSAELSEKVKRGNRESRLKGLFTGGHVLYGYKIIDKKYVIDEEEAKIVKEIFLKAASGETYRSIADNLNSRGIRRRGKLFTMSMLNSLIHRRKYLGIVETNGEVYTNIVPAIIDEEIFRRAATESLTNQKKGATYSARINYYLSGKIYCSRCGVHFVSESGPSKSKGRRYYYACSNKKYKHNCSNRYVKKELLEKEIYEFINALFINNKRINDFINDIADSYNDITEYDIKMNNIQDEIKEIDIEIANILTAIKKGIIDDLVNDELEKLKNKKQSLEVEYKNLELKASIKLTPDRILELIRTFKSNKESIEEKMKKILTAFVRRIDVYDESIIIQLYPLDDYYVKKKIDAYMGNGLINVDSLKPYKTLNEDTIYLLKGNIIIKKYF